MKQAQYANNGFCVSFISFFGFLKLNPKRKLVALCEFVLQQQQQQQLCPFILKIKMFRQWVLKSNQLKEKEKKKLFYLMMCIWLLSKTNDGQRLQSEIATDRWDIHQIDGPRFYIWIVNVFSPYFIAHFVHVKRDRFVFFFRFVFII